MKNKHIKKVKQLGAGGLGLFLITGLTGCDGVNNKCKDMSILPQSQLEECRSHHGFIPINTYAGAGASTSKSGFFSSSEGHSSTSSSHTSSSSGG